MAPVAPVAAVTAVAAVERYGPVARSSRSADRSSPATAEAVALGGAVVLSATEADTVVVRLEAVAEAEGRGRRSVRPEVSEPGDGLVHRRDPPLKDPPQAQDRLHRRLEELAAAAEELHVRRAVGEVRQGVDRLPQAEVEDLQGVLEGGDAGGVAALVLEPPDEPGARVGQRVELIGARFANGSRRSSGRRWEPGGARRSAVPRASAPWCRTVADPGLVVVRREDAAHRRGERTAGHGVVVLALGMSDPAGYRVFEAGQYAGYRGGIPAEGRSASPARPSRPE